MYPYIILWIVAFVLCFGQAQAQSASYEDSPVEVQEFDRTQWEKLTKDLDYKEKQKRPKKKSDWKMPERLPSSFFGNSQAIARVVFYTLVIAILAFLIYRMIIKNTLRLNQKVKKKVVHTIEEADVDLSESELEKLLRQALESKAYRGAIRVYYLLIIKTLIDQGQIKEKKDKTNSEYLREMNAHWGYAAFRNLTSLFERIWYGEVDLYETQFTQLQVHFTKYIEALKVKNGK